jgi:hypothetical protein
VPPPPPQEQPEGAGAKMEKKKAWMTRGEWEEQERALKYVVRFLTRGY